MIPQCPYPNANGFQRAYTQFLPEMEFDPAEELFDSLGDMMTTMQGAYRNNGWIARIVNERVYQEVGNGFTPIPKTGDDKLNEQLRQLYDDLMYEVDCLGVGSLHTIVSMIVKGRVMNGDGLAIFNRIPKSRQGDRVLPFELQVIDASFLPYHHNEDLLENGNSIKHSIEVDPKGRRVAYHFRSPEKNTGEYVRIPARRVIHNFIPDRASQVRAVPPISKAIPKASSFEAYNKAELTRKESRAAFTGTIEREAETDADYKYHPVTGQPLNIDHSKIPDAKVEAGTFINLLVGEKAKLFETDDSGRGYPDYQRWQMLSISAFAGLPYELVTGDYGKINDRVWRAILNNMKRGIGHDQSMFDIPQILIRVWKYIVSLAIEIGVVKTDLPLRDACRVAFVPSAWEYVHPVQELEAIGKKIELGLSTRQNELEKLDASMTYDQIDDQQKKEESSRGQTNTKNPE